MSGWDDAGELVAEGIDWVVDKHYDKIHDGTSRTIGEQVRKIRKQPTKYDKKGNLLAPDQQPPRNSDPESPKSAWSAPEDPRNPYSGTDQYGQPGNQYSPPRFSDQDRARDLAGQGQITSDYYPRPETARSVQPAPDYATSRGIDGVMGDNGYGHADYGRDPRGSNGYDDGYDAGDADDYRRAYRPDRPQPYDPSRYVPHAGVAAAAVAPQQGSPRYLPPPPTVPRAYDDPYDDAYSSDDSADRRRRARKAKSESGLRRYSSRGSSRGGRSERSDRDRGTHGSGSGSGDEDGEKKGPRHKTAATIGGALIGALAGYEISSRKGKPESFHTIAGAIVGAVGAREADKWYETRKEEKREHERKEREEREGEEKDSRYNDRYQF